MVTICENSILPRATSTDPWSIVQVVAIRCWWIRDQDVRWISYTPSSPDPRSLWGDTMVPEEIWDQSISAGKTAGTMPAWRDWSSWDGPRIVRGPWSCKLQATSFRPQATLDNGPGYDRMNLERIIWLKKIMIHLVLIRPSIGIS